MRGLDKSVSNIPLIQRRMLLAGIHLYFIRNYLLRFRLLFEVQSFT